MATKKVEVLARPGIDDEPVQMIAQSIKGIASTMKKIESSGLSRRGLCLLLADTPGLNFTECYNVLAALDRLGSKFIVTVKAELADDKKA